MTENEAPVTAFPAAGSDSAVLRRGILRLGARIREDMQQALERVFEQSERLSGSEDPATRGAADAIEEAAREIAARLSRFEEQALKILSAEAAADAADAEQESDADLAASADFTAGAEQEPGPGETAEAMPSPQLTRVLAGELSQLAQHADTPLDAGEADVLRPRIRRAARLANLWLTSSLQVRPQEELPPGAGTTSTHGPRPAPAADRLRAAAPSPGRSHGEPAAIIALADRVGRLQQAFGELQQRSSRRERYWREAIHELRNAAHAFTSWGFVLRRSELKDAPWFAPLVRAAEAVLRRAEEALAQERAADTSFAVHTSEMDLVPLARQALETIRPDADARGLSLAVASPSDGAPVMVMADPDRVEQIVHNLLRNAVAATPPGGSICITVARDQRSPLVEVEDTGPGVAENLFETLPTSGRTGPGKGFGVGLLLSRQLAERMGGSLETAPAQGGTGARFILHLPAAP